VTGNLEKFWKLNRAQVVVSQRTLFLSWGLHGNEESKELRMEMIWRYLRTLLFGHDFFHFFYFFASGCLVDALPKMFARAIRRCPEVCHAQLQPRDKFLLLYMKLVGGKIKSH
jgi:hypothetical protein